jgi:hypothetical protein
MACQAHANHPARVVALAAGEKTFDTGKACSHGHTSPRYVGTGICIRCQEIRNAKRSTGRKPGRPKVKRVKPKAQPHRVVQSRPRSISIKRPLSAAIADYAHTLEARERSEHLDTLIRNVTAKKVPDGKRETLA